MGSKQENTSISLQMAIELINHIDFQVERKYYYEALNRRSNLKTSMLTQIDAPWSRTSYNGLIEAIEKCLTWEKQKEKATQPSEFDIKVHSFYDILYENGVKTLILKEKSKDNSLIKVIADHKSFNLIAFSHIINNHCPRNQLISVLKENYMVNTACIDMFFSIHKCPGTSSSVECNTQTQTVRNSFFNECYVLIINMELFFDDPYNFILVLVDKGTDFVILRPLLSMNETELTTEFIKIFTNFGSPNFLYVNDNFSLFRSIINEINTLCADFNTIVFQDQDVNIYRYNKKVITLLREWIRSTNSSSWAVGVQMVQWKLNNVCNDGLKRSTAPCDKVFNKYSNSPIGSLPIWARVNGDGETPLVDFDNVAEIIMKRNTGSDNSVMMEEDNNYNLLLTTVKCPVCYHEINNIKYCNKCSKAIHYVCGKSSIVNEKLETICFLCL